MFAVLISADLCAGHLCFFSKFECFTPWCPPPLSLLFHCCCFYDTRIELSFLAFTNFSWDVWNVNSKIFTSCEGVNTLSKRASVSKFLTKRWLLQIFDWQYSTDLSCFFNESISLKTNLLTSQGNKPNIHISYDCSDLIGFFMVTF